MPDDIREELESTGRMADYRARPHYQRNDYLAWIGRAASPATRRRRTDRMLRELGHEPSVVGVARLYRDVAATLVIDEADRALAPEVRDAGMECVVAETVMVGADEAAALARVVLDAARRQ